MLHFSDRVQKETKQAKAFEEWVEKSGGKFIRTSQEMIKGDVNYSFPDYIAEVDGKTFFVELKNTPSISKRSYDFCCSLNRVFPTYFIISSEGKSNHRLPGFYLIKSEDIVFWTREDAINNGHESHIYVDGSDIWRNDNENDTGSGQVYGSARYKANSTFIEGMTDIYNSKISQL